MISSSGTLVTLLFGLSAVATTAERFKLPGAAKPPAVRGGGAAGGGGGRGHRDQRAAGVKAAALARRLRPLVESPFWEYPARPLTGRSPGPN